MLLSSQHLLQLLVCDTCPPLPTFSAQPGQPLAPDHVLQPSDLSPHWAVIPRPRRSLRGQLDVRILSVSVTAPVPHTLPGLSTLVERRNGLPKEDTHDLKKFRPLTRPYHIHEQFQTSGLIHDVIYSLLTRIFSLGHLSKLFLYKTTQAI